MAKAPLKNDFGDSIRRFFTPKGLHSNSSGCAAPRLFYAEGVAHGENSGDWLRVIFLRVEPLRGTLCTYTVPRVRRK